MVSTRTSTILSLLLTGHTRFSYNISLSMLVPYKLHYETETNTLESWFLFFLDSRLQILVSYLLNKKGNTIPTSKQI